MEIRTSSLPASQFAADLLVLFFPEQGIVSGSHADAIDRASGGKLAAYWATGEVSAKPGKTTLLVGFPGIEAKSLLIVGTGKETELDAHRMFRAASTAMKVACSRERKTVALAWDGIANEQTRSAIIGSIYGTNGEDIYKQKKSTFAPASLIWLGVNDTVLHEAVIVASNVNWARQLVNQPPNRIYPESFCDEILSAFDGLPVEIEIWNEAKLRAEQCNALLAVASGSQRPARLAILRYKGTQAETAPLALVGKGVTFDSGGLSIKPTDGMTTMKCDMAGAAAVVATIRAAAQLEVAQPLVGLVGLVENMLGGGCFRLGDVIRSRQGKTIEILNTDAEGRVVLADVLDVAKGYRPSHIVDLATLTGACVVALGTDIAGIMSNNESLQQRLIQASKRAGEWLWPLPMHAHFSEQISSRIADIKNVGDGRWGGAITAAKFLEEFVDQIPWSHIDIAGPAFLDSAKSWSDAGGTGALVRTLIEWVKTPEA